MDSANDMKAAVKTYDGFIHLLKTIIPVVAILIALIVIAIAN